MRPPRARGPPPPPSPQAPGSRWVQRPACKGQPGWAAGYAPDPHRAPQPRKRTLAGTRAAPGSMTKHVPFPPSVLMDKQINKEQCRKGSKEEGHGRSGASPCFQLGGPVGRRTGAEGAGLTILGRRLSPGQDRACGPRLPWPQGSPASPRRDAAWARALGRASDPAPCARCTGAAAVPRAPGGFALRPAARGRGESPGPRSPEPRRR